MTSWVLGAAGVVVALAALGRYTVVPLYRAIRSVERIVEQVSKIEVLRSAQAAVLGRLETLASDVKGVHAEVRSARTDMRDLRRDLGPMLEGLDKRIGDIEQARRRRELP